MKNCVSLVDVDVSYGSRHALTGLTAAFAPGVTGVLGINGAGKTTLLSVLAHAHGFDSGKVEWFGEAASSRTRRLVALMPQEFTPPPGFRLDDYLVYVGWLRGLSKGEARSRVPTVLTGVGLAERSDESLSSLSGGMLRRVALAQALISEPRLLLLDEPTTGLDPEQRRAMRELVREHGSTGAVTIMSSHLIEDIMTVCDRVIILREGRASKVMTIDALNARLDQQGSDRELALIAMMNGSLTL